MGMEEICELLKRTNGWVEATTIAEKLNLSYFAVYKSLRSMERQGEIRVRMRPPSGPQDAGISRKFVRLK